MDRMRLQFVGALEKMSNGKNINKRGEEKKKKGCRENEGKKR
jgi:hypothetical protein